MCGLPPLSNNQNTATEAKATAARRATVFDLTSTFLMRNFGNNLLSVLCHSHWDWKSNISLVFMWTCLILTFTFLRDLIELVPCRAFALKGSDRVDTVSSLTDARDGLALIHICTYRAYHYHIHTHTGIHTRRVL